MKNRTDIASALVILFFCAIGAFSTRSLPGPSGTDVVGPSTFPVLILTCLVIASSLLLIRGMYNYPARDNWPEFRILKRTLGFLVFFCVYLVALVILGVFFATIEDPIVTSGGGFAISTFFFLLFGLPMLGRKNKKEIILTATITTTTLLCVFGGFFQVILP